ncbi:DUF2062 domain-containing protein [Histidinibacterium lentulum]|uniref:DUF2062 domain-containing protein n=1 Tax=Histidinibacterium lentulum TaxID=2480588 RepID=A0A3N2R5F3_9RHOB|nr:DUF2062 domain-containing protein [Histidinibacterium lentulum]ROU02719.1 DUF2062 domain-containing protein [Histidinibacterium lentulum]
MVFKRRDRRPVWEIVFRAVWPKGGWGRAAQYVRHRLRRLPDTPEKICRGIWAGVFVTFTPFYGLHFVISAALAWIMRGNILASILATFFGNPLTYVPIGIVSLQTGYWLLGTRPEAGFEESFARKFAAASADLWHNVMSVFTPATADWSRLAVFYREVFVPYTVGGILPGIVTATVIYCLALPVVRAYQNRRKAQLRRKLGKLKSGVDAGLG